MQAGTRYPPVGFHFRVEFLDIPGLQKQDAFFQEVGGLTKELTVETVASGGENRFSYKLPKRAQYSNLTLKRGLFVGSGLVRWVNNAIEEMDIQPATVIVSLLNERHEPLQTFRFVNAWPQKWSVSSFNAEQSQIVVENMELAYQYFTSVATGSEPTGPDLNPIFAGINAVRGLLGI